MKYLKLKESESGDTARPTPKYFKMWLLARSSEKQMLTRDYASAASASKAGLSAN